MKRTIKNIMMVALATAAIGMVSCSKDENNGSTSADTSKASVIASNFVDKTVAPTYTNLAAKADELVQKLQTLSASRTDANVAAACEVFLDARDWWEKSEAFLFGAATDFGIDPHIDSWPLDVDGFNNLMNSPAMLTSLAGDEGDVYAGDYLGNALLGFHGIEYILFANGQPKAASAITNNQMTYAIAVAGDLRNRCFQLEVSWLGDDAPAAHIEKVEDLELNCTLNGGYSYGENMKNAGRAGSSYVTAIAALEAIVDGCRTIADEVGTSKIGQPYSGEDINYIESPYSQKSVIDFYNNIISIQNVYFGGVQGQRDENNSLHSFVASFNSSLDAEVVAAINNALLKIDAMPKPFVNNISDARNGEAADACGELDEVLGKLNAALRNLE